MEKHELTLQCWLLNNTYQVCMTVFCVQTSYNLICKKDRTTGCGESKLGDLYWCINTDDTDSILKYLATTCQCQQCTLGTMILFSSYCQLFHSEAFDKFDSELFVCASKHQCTLCRRGPHLPTGQGKNVLLFEHLRVWFKLGNLVMIGGRIVRVIQQQ